MQQWIWLWLWLFLFEGMFVWWESGVEDSSLKAEWVGIADFASSVWWELGQ